MTKHTTTKVVPDVIEYGRFSSNGQVPQAGALGRLARAVNHVAHWHPKGFALSQDLAATPTGTEAEQEHWFALIRTGEDTSGLRCHVGLAKADTVSTDGDPYVFVEATPSGGSSFDSDEIHYTEHETTTSVVTPDDILHGFVSLDVDPDTEYELVLKTVNYARPIYLTVIEIPRGYKVDDTDDGTVNPAPFIVENDIEDDDIQDLLEAATTLWRHNATHLIAWSLMNPGNWPSTTSSSYEEVHADGVYRLDLNQHNTVNGKVPVVFGARAGTSGATGGDVRLYDVTDGVELVKVSDFPNDFVWLTAAAELDPDISGHDLRLEFRNDDGSELFLEAVTLYEYES